MHLVAMKLIGYVFRVAGTPWDYDNNVRPLVLGVGGYVSCEVVLKSPNKKITKDPESAELHFYRVVQLEDGIEEINLYGGPAKVCMKFRPLTLTDMSAADVVD